MSLEGEGNLKGYSRHWITVIISSSFKKKDL